MSLNIKEICHYSGESCTCRQCPTGNPDQPRLPCSLQPERHSMMKNIWLSITNCTLQSMSMCAWRLMFSGVVFPLQGGPSVSWVCREHGGGVAGGPEDGAVQREVHRRRLRHPGLSPLHQHQVRGAASDQLIRMEALYGSTLLWDFITLFQDIKSLFPDCI